MTNWGWGTAASSCGLHRWTGKWTAYYYWAMYIQCSGDFGSCPKYLVRYIQAKTTANQHQRTSRGDKEVTSAQRRVPELELPYARIVCSNSADYRAVCSENQAAELLGKDHIRACYILSKETNYAASRLAVLVAVYAKPVRRMMWIPTWRTH